MKKKDLLKRLNKLTKLIAKTEPDVEPDTHLFSQHSINHEKNVMMVEEETYYKSLIEDEDKYVRDFGREKYEKKCNAFSAYISKIRKKFTGSTIGNT